MSVATLRLILLAWPLALLVAAPAAAQFAAPTAPCPPGEAQSTLRGQSVEAELFTNGNLFFGGTTTNGSGYTAPLGHPNGRVSPMFASNIWIGGHVGGEVRTAASRYTRFKLRPGVTGASGVVPDSLACAAADRIWSLTQLDSGEASRAADIRDWPVALGAPVINGDGIDGNYDLARGDRPAVRGDVMSFWAMTDTAAERQDGELPLGVDVTVEAFAIFDLRLHTFYHITVTNRNDVPIQGAALGIWSDWDLGAAPDDYVGTDTTRHMSYVYNEDEDDSAYGIPPAAGMVVVQGVRAEQNGADDDRDGDTDETGERMGLTSATLINKHGGIAAEAGTPDEILNRLYGLLNDGRPVYEFGLGYDVPDEEQRALRFAFPGDPTADAFWSNENIDRTGQDYFVGDKRGIAATGPVDLAPGESMDATFAVVFAQGTDRLDSVVRLRAAADEVLSAAEQGALEPAALRSIPAIAVPVVPLTVRHPSPNPFGTSTTLLLRESGSSAPVSVRVTVYDVLGRQVAAPTDVVVTPEARVEIGRGLASGVYLVRVSGRDFAETFQVVKAR